MTALDGYKKLGVMGVLLPLILTSPEPVTKIVLGALGAVYIVAQAAIDWKKAGK